MPKISEVYEKLYHYTTWDGLLGILKTKTLWATHYKFLNDYSEIILFRDKLVSLLLPHVREVYMNLIKKSPHIRKQITKEGGLDQVILHDTEVAVDAQYDATGHDIYILSFCGQHEDDRINSNGLLSQWRGYGSGGGFALVFDSKNLEELLNIEFSSFEYSVVHFSDLIYSDDDEKLEEELSEDLSVIANGIKLLFDRETLIDKKKRKKLEKAYRPFVNCITRYKHYGFSEENEVRVVALPTILNQEILKLASKDGATLKPEKEIRFRTKNGQLVPYIELFNSTDSELPIEKIIVGPHKEMETRAAALRVMLRDTKVEIRCSDIPFVG